MLIPRPNRLYHRIKARLSSCAGDVPVLDEISRMYGLGRLWRCQLPGAGRNTETVILISERGKWVLKQYRKGTQLPSVVFIHSVLARTGELDFPAPRLKLTEDGKDLVALDGHYYALLDFLPGYRYSDYYVIPKLLRRHYIERAGTVLARYHLIMTDFLPQGHRAEGYKSLGTKQRWDDYSWYCDEWNKRAALAARQGNGAQLLSPTRAAYIEKRLSELDDREKEQPLLPITVIHGDYGPYNLFFGSDSTFKAVLDFDDVRLEQRVDEVAASLRRFAGLSVGGLDPENARIFLDAYGAVNPLLAEELAQLPCVFQRIRLRGLVKALRRYQDTGNSLARYNVHHAISWLDWLEEVENAP
jgi:Ser/Thr protein kinase RdoA (MazF antagonist)